MAIPVFVYFKNNTKASVQLALCVYRASKNTSSLISFILHSLYVSSRVNGKREVLQKMAPSHMTFHPQSLQEVSRVNTLLASNNDIQGPNVMIGNAGLQTSNKILFCFCSYHREIHHE